MSAACLSLASRINLLSHFDAMGYSCAKPLILFPLRHLSPSALVIKISFGCTRDFRVNMGA
jgi:hypothetical protein